MGTQSCGYLSNDQTSSDGGLGASAGMIERGWLMLQKAADGQDPTARWMLKPSQNTMFATNEVFLEAGGQIPSSSIIRGRVKFVAGAGNNPTEITSINDKSSFYLSYSHPTLNQYLGHEKERRVLLDKEGYFSFWLAPELVSQANFGDRFIYVKTENSLRRKLYLPGYSGTIPNDFNHLAWDHGSSSTGFLDLALKYGDVDGDNQIQTGGTDANSITNRLNAGVWLTVPSTPLNAKTIHSYRLAADLNRDQLVGDADEDILAIYGINVTVQGAQ